jgi:nucleotide-binding universal stress UspA family protein
MINRILVPVDGSDHAEKAVEFAANSALQNDATMLLLHVFKPTAIPPAVHDYIKAEGLHESPSSVYHQSLETTGQEILDEAAAKAKSLGVSKVEMALVEGDPAETIIEYAKEHEYDIIIIGSRGLGGVKSLFLGSVSTKVCHATDRTCITVK